MREGRSFTKSKSPSPSSESDSQHVVNDASQNMPTSQLSHPAQKPPTKRRNRDRRNAAKASSSTKFAPQPPSRSSISETEKAEVDNYTHFDPALSSWTGTELRNTSSHLDSTMGPSLGHNRLATGFQKPPQVQRNGPEDTNNTSALTMEPHGHSSDNPIELLSSESDDSSEGGMVVNIKDAESITQPSGRLEIPETSRRSNSTLVQEQNAHSPMQVEKVPPPTSQPRIAPTTVRKPLRLVDLMPEQFDRQIRYAFFHLRREEVDPNRLAVCLECLQEGHIDESCPEKTCVHCQSDQHSSRECSAYKRCPSCRERGHSLDSCPSQLKNTTVPCDHCGSLGHVEDECMTIFFPARPPVLADSTLNLWISCCHCASQSHLVGDCPHLGSIHSTSTWSLKCLDLSQISNLTLESGALARGQDKVSGILRPVGLQIKGRASLHQAGVTKEDEMDQDEDEEPFIQRTETYGTPPKTKKMRVEMRETRRVDRVDSYVPSRAQPTAREARNAPTRLLHSTYRPRPPRVSGTGGDTWRPSR